MSDTNGTVLGSDRALLFVLALAFTVERSWALWTDGVPPMPGTEVLGLAVAAGLVAGLAGAYLSRRFDSLLVALPVGLVVLGALYPASDRLAWFEFSSLVFELTGLVFLWVLFVGVILLAGRDRPTRRAPA